MNVVNYWNILKNGNHESLELRWRIGLWIFVGFCLCFFWKTQIDATIYSYANPISKVFSSSEQNLGYPATSICPQEDETFTRACCYLETAPSGKYMRPEPLSLAEPYCYDFAVSSESNHISFSQTPKVEFLNSIKPCGVRTRHVSHAVFYSQRCMEFNFQSNPEISGQFPPGQDRMVIEFSSFSSSSSKKYVYSPEYGTYIYTPGADPSLLQSYSGCIKPHMDTVALVQQSITHPVNADPIKKYSIVGSCTENGRIETSLFKQTESYISENGDFLTQNASQLSGQSYSVVHPSKKRLVINFENFHVIHNKELVENDVFWLLGSLLWGLGMSRVSHMVLLMFVKSFIIPFFEEQQKMYGPLPLSRSNFNYQSKISPSLDSV